MNREEFQYNDRDISLLEKNNNKNSEENYFSSICLVPRVSVIVPVYNVEQYLTQCLDSILKQTLKDIEIICVDDGSTDHSSQILDEYKNRDPRIKVIHKDNKGYGHTINTGISIANGEYVGIVESDDSIMVNMYEKLYYQAVANDLDLVKGEFYYCWDEIGYRTPMHMDKMKDYYYQVLTEEDSDMFWEFPMNTWSGIYKRSFLLEKNISHHESPGASFQDNGFWVQTMCHARRAMWISDPLYLYRQDNENASVRGDKKAFALTDEYEWVEKKLKDQGVEDCKLDRCRYYRLVRHIGNFRRITDDLKLEICPTIVDDFSKYGYVFQTIKNETALSWFKEVVQNPEKYCDEHIEKRNALLKRLQDTDKLFIVSTSFFARRLLRILFRLGMSKKIICFIENGMIWHSRIGNIDVRSINDPKMDFSNSEVIIGERRGSESFISVLNMLQQSGVTQYICEDDISEVFYTIH